MVDNNEHEEFIKSKVSKDIDSVEVPQRLKEDIWRRIQSRKTKKGLQEYYHISQWWHALLY